MSRHWGQLEQRPWALERPSLGLEQDGPTGKSQARGRRRQVSPDQDPCDVLPSSAAPLGTPTSWMSEPTPPPPSSPAPPATVPASCPPAPPRPRPAAPSLPQRGHRISRRAGPLVPVPPPHLPSTPKAWEPPACVPASPRVGPGPRRGSWKGGSPPWPDLLGLDRTPLMPTPQGRPRAERGLAWQRSLLGGVGAANRLQLPSLGTSVPHWRLGAEPRGAGLPAGGVGSGSAPAASPSPLHCVQALPPCPSPPPPRCQPHAPLLPSPHPCLP